MSLLQVKVNFSGWGETELGRGHLTFLVVNFSSKRDIFPSETGSLTDWRFWPPQQNNQMTPTDDQTPTPNTFP